MSRWAIRPKSGPWRSVYLQGAFELRNGVPTAGGINTASPDTIKAMPPEMTFDYFAVRLNGEKAAGKKITLNIEFTDLKKPYSLLIENGVLNYAPKAAANADAKITLTKTTLDRIQLGEITPEQAIDVRRPEGRGPPRGVCGVRRHCSTSSRSGSTSSRRSATGSEACHALNYLRRNDCGGVAAPFFGSGNAAVDRLRLRWNPG